jgi:uncharacterized protein
MIDFHTYPIMIKELIAKDATLGKNIQDILGFYFPPQPLSVFLYEMDAAGIEKSVLLPLDCSTIYHCKIPSNETIADLVNKNPRFIGFASIDPGSKTAEKELHYSITQLGLKGLFLDPAIQRFGIGSKEVAYPLYQICLDLRIPVLIHCGINWSPKSLAKFANPLDIEDVAQDFPGLKIIISNLGWPWYREAIMLAMKYRNIYLDTSAMGSGTPKEMFSHLIGNMIGKGVFERNLHFQILYGSNFPRVDMRRTIKGINSLGFSEGFKKHLFLENAISVLGEKGKA